MKTRDFAVFPLTYAIGYLLPYADEPNLCFPTTECWEIYFFFSADDVFLVSPTRNNGKKEMVLVFPQERIPH
jgi:hypothetical protein